MESKLNDIAREFLFEENTPEVRGRVLDAYYEFLNQNIHVKEYVVKCDEDNNTVERIAAHELWVDVAVLENGAEEFTYYPVRVKPGEMIGESSE